MHLQNIGTVIEEHIWEKILVNVLLVAFVHGTDESTN